MSTLFLKVLKPHPNKDEYLVTVVPNLDFNWGLATMPPPVKRAEACKRLINSCNREELDRLESFLCGKALQITTTVSEESANKIQPNWRD